MGGLLGKLKSAQALSDASRSEQAAAAHAATGNLASSSSPVSPRRDEAATLRQNIAATRTRRNEHAAAPVAAWEQDRFAAQPTLLEAHGFFVDEGAIGLSQGEEAKLRAALSTLTQGSSEPENAWSNLRSAFLWGRKDKIDAALVLHQLGLFDLNTIGPEGDALVHAMVREPIENQQSAIATKDTGLLSIADRFALLKQHDVDFACLNSENQRPIELALSLERDMLSTMVEVLIAAGVDVHARNNIDETLLHVAARRGHFAAIGVLVKHHVDIDATEPMHRRTALHLAAQEGATEAVITLLANGAHVAAADSSGRTALHLAAQKGRTGIVKALLEKHAPIDAVDEDGTTALHVAAEAGEAEVVDALLENNARIDLVDSTGKTALHRAAIQGKAGAINALLDRGACIGAVDRDDLTALHLAARQFAGATADAVNALLERGACIDAVDKLGRTALHMAAQSGATRIVNALLGKGATVNMRTKYGETALHLTAIRRFGSVAIIHALLYKGAHIDAVTKKGDTALHLATRRGTVHAVNALLDEGASMTIKNRDNRTALQVAISLGARTVIAALQKFRSGQENR